MAWQQSGGYPYPQQQTAPPPPGFYPSSGYDAAAPKAYGGPMPQYHQQAPVYSSYPQYPPQDTAFSESSGMGFSSKTIRNGFIRKVYAILMCQLSISAAFIAFFLYKPGAREFAKHSPGLVLTAFIVTIACLLIMSCFESARRTAPSNYIFLLIFTVAESFLLGVICLSYDADEVLLAVAICAVICFALTIFAFQTKIDFTTMGAILFVCVILLFIFGLVLMFWQSDAARLVYACLGALLFSVYLIYDTQLMIGGDHKYAISPEEYIFAALNLYIDIVQIFLMILQILGSSRD